MVKKIIVFMLLFVFLVGVGVPVQAKAEDNVKYSNVEDFMENMGYVFTKKEDCYYVVVSDEYNARLKVLELYYPHDEDGIFLARDTTYNNLWFFTDEAYAKEDCVCYNFYLPAKAAEQNKFDYVSSQVASCRESVSSYNGVYKNLSYICLVTAITYNLDVLYSDFNIYQVDRQMVGSNTNFNKSIEILYFESNRLGPYTFEAWCIDSGLNCIASSNESDSVIPFSFHPDSYYYIVRKNRISGSQYIWYLSQVTKEDELIYYSTNRALANSTIGAAALYVLSGEYAAGSTKVKNFVYDSSGAGWLYTDHYFIDLGLTNEYYVDDIGITYSSSMPIVYSSADIYSDKEQSSVYYAASTDYEDSEVTYPDISPTSTPTPTPISNSGSSGGGSSGSGIVVGGQAKPGGLMELALYFIRWVWTDLFAVQVPVDGYDISVQEVIIYSLLVSLLGAALGYSIFGGKKGG